MSILKSAIIFILIGVTKCHKHGINRWFEHINSEFVENNQLAAQISWESSIQPDNPDLPEKAASYQRKLIEWQHRICGRLASLQSGHLLNNTQMRQSYLLCRGPVYTFEEARETSALYDDLQSIYSNAEVCIPTVNSNIFKSNVTQIEDAILYYLSTVREYLNLEDQHVPIELAVKLAVSRENKKGYCLKGETDFDNVFQLSRNEKVLRWLWLAWREVVGPPMKKPYRRLVDVENVASRRNGFPNIGAAWRDELEIPNLRRYCRRLYSTIEPLYRVLHGVVRYYLRKKYGDIVPERGAIPAHLLGNLWAQDWRPLVDLIVPSDINIDQSIKKINWTVDNMVKRAEDFYQSIGLPPMTDIFWRKSVLSRQNNSTRCHGTAADMFQDGDFRLLYCAGTSAEDMYVIHHEMGHIHYYMAYERQPGIFRQGANTAFHESIGDAIMYGVTSPQHLNRLGLINDSILYTTEDFGNEDDDLEESENVYVKSPPDDENNRNFEGISIATKENIIIAKDTNEGKDDVQFTSDDILLLKQALNKIPHIPFSLLVDEYRWEYFEGDIKEGSINKRFWAKVFELQGVSPPGQRDEDYFDVGAKFHVPDNTPYIRYFLSSFLQHQLFASLCKAAVFGRRGVQDPVPPSIALHRCDIYGSKAAGKLLRDIMSRGSSQHWRDILQATIYQDDISAEPLKLYYRPLYKVLGKLVRKLGIPIGW